MRQTWKNAAFVSLTLMFLVAMFAEPASACHHRAHAAIVVVVARITVRMVATATTKATRGDTATAANMVRRGRWTVR